jgi:hypothetical protein
MYSKAQRSAYKSRPLISILRQMNSFQITSSYFCKFHRNIVLPPKSGLQTGLFISGFPTKILNSFLFSPFRAISFTHLILFDMTSLNTFGEHYEIQNTNYHKTPLTKRKNYTYNVHAF